MWPPPLVFVLPRDWETLDFLSVSFIFLFGFVLFRGWEDGEGEEEAAGIEPWNSPLSLLTPRAWWEPRAPAWESLLVSSTPQCFSSGTGSRQPRESLRLFDSEAKILVGSRRCRPAGSRLGNLAGEASPCAVEVPGAMPSRGNSP